jgi:hypothetical protein
LTYTRLREFLRGMADVRGVTNSENAGKGGEGGLNIHNLAGHPLPLKTAENYTQYGTRAINIRGGRNHNTV